MREKRERADSDSASSSSDGSKSISCFLEAILKANQQWFSPRQKWEFSRRERKKEKTALAAHSVPEANFHVCHGCLEPLMCKKEEPSQRSHHFQLLVCYSQLSLSTGFIERGRETSTKDFFSLKLKHFVLSHLVKMRERLREFFTHVKCHNLGAYTCMYTKI